MTTYKPIRIAGTESLPGRTIAVTVEWHGKRVRVEIVGEGHWKADETALAAEEWDDFWRDFHTDKTVHGVAISEIHNR